MSTIGEGLAYYYMITNRTRKRHGKEPIDKGTWMMETYPNRYKNKRQAAAAFNVTVRNARPGNELAEASKVEHTTKFRGVSGTKLGGQQAGQWTAIVHYEELDGSGNTSERIKSFNVSSSEHTTLLAVPYLKEYLLPVAQEKLGEWCDEYGGENCTITYIEVYPTARFGKEAIDFDSLFI